MELDDLDLDFGARLRELLARGGDDIREIRRARMRDRRQSHSRERGRGQSVDHQLQIDLREAEIDQILDLELRRELILEHLRVVGAYAE